MKEGFTVFLIALLAVACGGQGGQVARDVGAPALAQVAAAAAPELSKLAQRHGLQINEAGAVCYPVSDALEAASDVDLPLVAIMCVAPEL